MKIETIPGEFGFPAAYKYSGHWEITDCVFFTIEEAMDYFTDKIHTDFKWPVEKQEGGIVYVPTKAELE